MSAQQVDKQIEYLLSMDENQLVYAFQTLISLQKYIKPLARVYLVIDKYTRGYGKIVMGAIGAILLIIVLYLLYQLVSWIFYTIIYYAWNAVDSVQSLNSDTSSSVSSSSSSSQSSSSQSSSSKRSKPIDVNNVDDEFEF